MTSFIQYLGDHVALAQFGPRFFSRVHLLVYVQTYLEGRPYEIWRVL